MMVATHRGRRIELLLNTLRGERYARRSLLSELLDELDAADEYRLAAHAARAFLDKVDGFRVGSELEYEREINRLADLAARPVQGRPAAA